MKWRRGYRLGAGYFAFLREVKTRGSIDRSMSLERSDSLRDRGSSGESI